jgi:hypothetical protein
MRMAHGYRIYLLDSRNRISLGYEFEGPDDAAAIKEADLLAGGNSVEVWHRSRLVAYSRRKAG